MVGYVTVMSAIISAFDKNVCEVKFRGGGVEQKH
jgi:hypothetical protein